MKANRIFIAILIILVIVLGWRQLRLGNRVEQLTEQATAANYNNKVLNFTDLFIVKILRAQGEVDFETRLQLENAVRDLNDPKILAAWQKFTSAQTELEAQEELKNLLEILIKSIRTA